MTKIGQFSDENRQLLDHLRCETHSSLKCLLPTADPRIVISLFFCLFWHLLRVLFENLPRNKRGIEISAGAYLNLGVEPKSHIGA